ncbi:MAG: hypothetical protein H7Y07_14595 [Pyrinomonadaceae bacterium]|nr:hypothetical protein [Sphingobacteriaceae bacterium]
MQIILLKLILTPLLTGAATWAGRKYGHNVSGLLIGLPLNAGPIALFLALQHGETFASQSAKGIILGAVSLAIYSIVYAALSRKLHWLLCALSGWVAYLSATFLFNQFSLELLPIFFLSVLMLLFLLLLFPKYKEEDISIIPPSWDLPLRVILATLFILGLTYISGNLGSNLSGLLSTFPIFGTIFAVTTHYLYGSNACIRLLRGVIISLFSFVVFFLILASFIQTLGIGFTFWLATGGCFISQGIIVFWERKWQDRKKDL